MKNFTLYLYFLLFIFTINNSNAQQQDHTWWTGYGRNFQSPGDTLGTNIFNFNDLSHLSIGSTIDCNLDFIDITAGMNDAEGNPLFYFDGKNIADASFAVMQNGSQVNVTNNVGGFPVPQGAIVLPDPGHADRYFLFHVNYGFYPNGYGVYELRYSIVDMTLNGGLGAVTQKRVLLLHDDEGLDYGRLTAVRHANGRDWWLLMQQKNTGLFYRILLDPQGPHLLENQTIPGNFHEGLGQAVFSADGRWHVRFTTVDQWVGQFLDIFEFDRCEGSLSLHSQLQYDEDVYTAGAAISYNSRYLYISSFEAVYQFDLWAEDILATKKTVAVSDGFGGIIPMTFHLSQLAPDGRIYIVSGRSAYHYLHLIHYPHKYDTLCAVEQHGLYVPKLTANSLPNFPNFRLGPIDGSPCDTLGLTNFPVALWRYDQDTSNYLHVEFTDLSYYEPQTWAWDFDDGTTSQDTSPVHLFPEPGIYEVCLTVTNANGSHTWCRKLYLGVPNATHEPEDMPVSIFPNPTSGRLQVSLPDGLISGTVWWTLQDAAGRPIKTGHLAQGNPEIDVSALPAGIYFYTLTDREKWQAKGKVIKMD